jgi:carbon-monoxide dehydrogenase medium subunit
MQVPAHFDYDRATSVDEALAMLSRAGPNARVVAGGHSLIPMMKLRLAQPECLIDINGVAELNFIRLDGSDGFSGLERLEGLDGWDGTVLRIGAMVRHAELLASALVREHFPIMVDAERVIADPVVRNRGTVGGSVCQADPSEDLSAVFAALRATGVIRGPAGERTVSMREFHTGPYETVVGQDELLVELRVPITPGTGSAYEKVERRAGDWPVAAAGAVLRLAGGSGDGGSGDRGSGYGSSGDGGSGDGRSGDRGSGSGDDGDLVTEIGIGLTAVGAEHFVATEAEDALRGRPATEENFAEAGRVAARHCRPSADQRGPVDYKRHLAGELTVRALRRAAARATGREV